MSGAIMPGLVMHGAFMPRAVMPGRSWGRSCIPGTATIYNYKDSGTVIFYFHHAWDSIDLLLERGHIIIILLIYY